MDLPSYQEHWLSLRMAMDSKGLSSLLVPNLPASLETFLEQPLCFIWKSRCSSPYDIPHLSHPDTPILASLPWLTSLSPMATQRRCQAAKEQPERWTPDMWILCRWKTLTMRETWNKTDVLSDKKGHSLKEPKATWTDCLQTMPSVRPHFLREWYCSKMSFLWAENTHSSGIWILSTVLSGWCCTLQPRMCLHSQQASA